MAKKLKTLAAERSLDEVELNRRNCTIRQYAEKLTELKELCAYSSNENMNTLLKRDQIQVTTIAEQKFMECAPYSDNDSNISLMCEISSKETLSTP